MEVPMLYVSDNIYISMARMKHMNFKTVANIFE